MLLEPITVMTRSRTVSLMSYRRQFYRCFLSSYKFKAAGAKGSNKLVSQTYFKLFSLVKQTDRNNLTRGYDFCSWPRQVVRIDTPMAE
ncbi:hypothetical protein RRG08_003942 [Elysia crispata]|uniref:Uncharacterized protein n=1 Tax=Elysia crispata TaxID=231223 RepID=A0AAE1CWD2_9GAST|nr:hypothetical protein RRG08_003942 [Elysia crispata]